MTRIYVGLLEEGVHVWRPVNAEHIQDDVYRILDQPYDRDTEQWEFEPGDEVTCELVETSEGWVLAAAARKSE